MKLKFTEDTLFLGVVIFIIGCGVLLILPKFEQAENYVKLGTTAIGLPDNATKAEYPDVAALIVIPVEWSAPWAGSCYLTIDARPFGAPKGEPETAEWDQNHLIRAKYEGRWWTQKWINVYVVQQRQGRTELRYAIVAPGTEKIDVYAELKCDDQLLDQISTSVDYPIS